MRLFLFSLFIAASTSAQTIVPILRLSEWTLYVDFRRLNQPSLVSFKNSAVEDSYNALTLGEDYLDAILTYQNPRYQSEGVRSRFLNNLSQGIFALKIASRDRLAAVPLTDEELVKLAFKHTEPFDIELNKFAPATIDLKDFIVRLISPISTLAKAEADRLRTLGDEGVSRSGGKLTADNIHLTYDQLDNIAYEKNEDAPDLGTVLEQMIESAGLTAFVKSKFPNFQNDLTLIQTLAGESGWEDFKKENAPSEAIPARASATVEQIRAHLLKNCTSDVPCFLPGKAEIIGTGFWDINLKFIAPAMPSLETTEKPEYQNILQTSIRYAERALEKLDEKNEEYEEQLETEIAKLSDRLVKLIIKSKRHSELYTGDEEYIQKKAVVDRWRQLIQLSESLKLRHSMLENSTNHAKAKLETLLRLQNLAESSSDPFFKTPPNINSRWLDLSPLGNAFRTIEKPVDDVEKISVGESLLGQETPIPETVDISCLISAGAINDGRYPSQWIRTTAKRVEGVRAFEFIFVPKDGLPGAPCFTGPMEAQIPLGRVNPAATHISDRENVYRIEAF